MPKTAVLTARQIRQLDETVYQLGLATARQGQANFVEPTGSWYRRQDVSFEQGKNAVPVDFDAVSEDGLKILFWLLFNVEGAVEYFGQIDPVVLPVEGDLLFFEVGSLIVYL